MPKIVKPLTVKAIERLASRPGLHAVGGEKGLYLTVNESAGCSWVLRVKIGARRTDIGLGSYPAVTLAEAREKAGRARKQIAEGGDPVQERKAARASLVAEQAKVITFAEAAKQCHTVKAKSFKNPKHRADWISSIEAYANPVIGKLPVSAVELPHILKILMDPAARPEETLWERVPETASRLQQRLEVVMNWATVRGYRKGENPARWKGHLSEVLPAKKRRSRIKHYPAIPWQQVGGFMGALHKQLGIAARALEFAILTAARSGEVRNATWDEIDLEKKLWTVPAERMKAGKTHRVPLSTDAVELLKSLPRMQGNDHVFPAPRGGALSDMAISSVCRRMGVEAVPHGFRSTFKDWARNRSRYPDEVSELALAHVNSDATRAAYARDELLPQRTRMMTDWAKYLREVPVTADVTSIGEATHG